MPATAEFRPAWQARVPSPPRLDDFQNPNIVVLYPIAHCHVLKVCCWMFISTALVTMSGALRVDTAWRDEREEAWGVHVLDADRAVVLNGSLLPP